jgi:hypothetical protein
VKKIYSKFRIGLMAFALGLAGVYMTERFPSAPYVELPTAVSTDVFHVFPANTHFFYTRDELRQRSGGRSGPLGLCKRKGF